MLVEIYQVTGWCSLILSTGTQDIVSSHWCSDRPHCQQQKQTSHSQTHTWEDLCWRTQSSSRMRVIYHNWSATKQRPHPQSVAEISHHSVLSGDRIRQWNMLVEIYQWHSVNMSQIYGVLRQVQLRSSLATALLSTLINPKSLDRSLTL